MELPTSPREAVDTTLKMDSFVDPYFGARVVKQDISGTAVIGRVRAADGARPDVSPNIPLSGDGE